MIQIPNLVSLFICLFKNENNNCRVTPLFSILAILVIEFESGSEKQLLLKDGKVNSGTRPKSSTLI